MPSCKKSTLKSDQREANFDQEHRLPSDWWRGDIKALSLYYWVNVDFLKYERNRRKSRRNVKRMRAKKQSEDETSKNSELVLEKAAWDKTSKGSNSVLEKAAWDKTSKGSNPALEKAAWDKTSKGSNLVLEKAAWGKHVREEVSLIPKNSPFRLAANSPKVVDPFWGVKGEMPLVECALSLELPAPSTPSKALAFIYL